LKAKVLISKMRPIKHIPLNDPPITLAKVLEPNQK